MARHSGRPGPKQAAIELIDPSTWKLTRTLPLDKSAARGVALSQDGRRVIGTGLRNVYLWDTESGKLIWKRTAALDRQWLERVAVSSDGQKIGLVVMSRDVTNLQPRSYSSRGSIHLLRMSDGRLLAELAGPGTPEQFEFSADNQSLFAGMKRFSTGQGELFPMVLEWDLATNKRTDRGLIAMPNDGSFPGFLALDDQRHRVCVGSSGSVLSSKLSFWDLKLRKEIRTLTLPSSAQDVQFLPDGKHIVVANRNGTVYTIRVD